LKNGLDLDLDFFNAGLRSKATFKGERSELKVLWFLKNRNANTGIRAPYYFFITS
jgi:hypothetical protein